MVSVNVRIFSKITLFLLVFSFLFFIVVYGYRYNTTLNAFIIQNVHLKFSFWSDDGEVFLDGKKFVSDNQKLSLYNMDPGCYTLKINNREFQQCFDNNNIYDFSVISYISKKSLGSSIVHRICENFQSVEFDNNCIANKCFDEQIKNVFYYNRIFFVQVGDRILYCNNDFSFCNKLLNFEGSLVCANKDGIIGHTTSGYVLLDLQ